jgi:hypothetical protein
MTLPAVVTDAGSASSHRVRDERSPPVAATDSQLREGARFVISPDGHADDANLKPHLNWPRSDPSPPIAVPVTRTVLHACAVYGHLL